MVPDYKPLSPEMGAINYILAQVKMDCQGSSRCSTPGDGKAADLWL